MKKAMIFMLLLIGVVCGKSIDVSAYTYYASWSNYGDYASQLNIDVDTDTWQLYSWFFKEMKDPTSYTGVNDRDFGNLKIWVGIYHTIENETVFIYPNVKQRDVFLVVYKVVTGPQYDNEQGFTNYLEVSTDIDQYLNAGEYNILLEYGPEDVNESHSYTISSGFGVTPNGPEASFELSETITIHDMEIDSTTSDPDFYTIYNYANGVDNDYADSEHPHYGYMIIETDPNNLTLLIKFKAHFTDWDNWPWGYRENSYFETNFYFSS